MTSKYQVNRVKESAVAEYSTLEQGMLQRLLAEIIGSSASEKVMTTLEDNAAIEPGVMPKLFLEHFTSDLGLTPKQVSRLKAAVELGKQLFLPTPKSGSFINDPEVGSEIFNQLIGFESVEKFAVLVLDVQNRLLATKVLFSGTETETLASPQTLFRCVLRLGGTRCLVGHNHPSGSLTPSSTDLDLTKLLLQAGNCVDIPVLDHLIVSGGQFLSIRSTTCLWNPQLT